MIMWLFIMYAAIGILSLVVLILMLAMGGMEGLGIDVDVDVDLDVEAGGGGTGMGPFSIPLLLSFFSAFGGIGALLIWMDVVNPGATPFIALLGAFIMAGAVFFVLQAFLKAFTSDSTVRIGSLKGARGTVSVSIKKGKEGQVVVVTPERGRTLLGAISDTDIPMNTEVVVIDTMGDVVKVMSKKAMNARKRGKGGPKRSRK